MLGSCRLCVRCTGVLAGLLIGALVFSYMKEVNWFWLTLLIITFPLPAVATFILYEERKIPNMNKVRFITGALLGATISCGIILHYGLLLLALLWLFLLEIVTLFYLDRLGLLSPFIKQYEDSVYLNEN